MPPKHIGIIMDGNGRWAQQRGLQRVQGHREGLTSAKSVVKTACEAGVSYLTLYTFSTENWKRTEEEVSFLMGLIRTNLRKEYDFYKLNDIRVVHSGDISSLPREIQDEIFLVEKETAQFASLVVNLAINYGGRNEILRAYKKAVAQGVKPENMSEADVQLFLDHPDIPDLDIVIRTGGEQRLSNFMLWRSSYAELYFTETLWPDFSSEEFNRILDWFYSRTRRFGGSAEGKSREGENR